MKFDEVIKSRFFLLETTLNKIKANRQQLLTINNKMVVMKQIIIAAFLIRSGQMKNLGWTIKN